MLINSQLYKLQQGISLEEDILKPMLTSSSATFLLKHETPQRAHLCCLLGAWLTADIYHGAGIKREGGMGKTGAASL